jgi:hypothetical protein
MGIPIGERTIVATTGKCKLLQVNIFSECEHQDGRKPGASEHGRYERGNQFGATNNTRFSLET